MSLKSMDVTHLPCLQGSSGVSILNFSDFRNLSERSSRLGLHLLGYQTKKSQLKKARDA